MEIEFILVLREQADLADAASKRSRSVRGAFVATKLSEVAARTQAPLLSLLESHGVEHRGFWIANMIWVRADRDWLARLASRPEVLRVDANPTIDAEPKIVTRSTAPKSAAAIEWNVTQIRAHELWALGYTGQGVVIGGQDTGYDWDHPALIGSYRGWDGLTANHDYSWHDAIHSGGGVCGADSPEPCDDGSHGTHTMGSMVGDDGGANQIGISPGATWIGWVRRDSSRWC